MFLEFCRPKIKFLTKGQKIHWCCQDNTRRKMDSFDCVTSFTESLWFFIYLSHSRRFPLCHRNLV